MIHKANPIKGALRKRNQAPFEVYGFRLNDKVAYLDKAYFISSRRSSGSFELKLIDGTRLKESVNYKKLRLLQRRTGGFITEFRTEGGGASSPELPLGYPRRY